MIKRLVALAALGLVGLLILPVAVIATANAQGAVAGPPTGEARDDIPPRLLTLYQQAVVDRCPTLPWSVVAGIGKIESNHGRRGGAELEDDGTVSPPIIGVALDGSGGTQKILDIDGGLYDNDDVYDRAVGPMQFIPQTWVSIGMDADRNGVADPHDVDDAVRQRRPTCAAPVVATRRGFARRSGPTTTAGSTSTRCSPGLPATQRSHRRVRRIQC